MEKIKISGFSILVSLLCLMATASFLLYMVHSTLEECYDAKIRLAKGVLMTIPLQASPASKGCLASVETDIYSILLPNGKGSLTVISTYIEIKQQIKRFVDELLKCPDSL